jgi:hypothetical protein
MTAGSRLPTVRGRCHASFAFDLGRDVDLDRCERLIAETERQTVRHRRRVPQHFDYRPAPLRLTQPAPDRLMPGLLVERVDLVLYDFGAAAVSYTVPFAGSLDALVDLAVALEDNSTLPRDARARLDSLVRRLGAAVSRPRVAEPVEDYLIVEIERLDPPAAPDRRSSTEAPALAPAALWTECGPVTAQVLRATRDPLSPEEVREALHHRLSFATTDVTIVDWNAAILYDPDPEETRVLLEFANVQLLQLRQLDQELDRAVDQAYEALARAERGPLHSLRPPTGGLRRLGELQMDGAVLFERVTNALKLVGDQFLSRVYGAISERFHFADWDRAITRKLVVIDGIYQKLSDRVMARRLEALEWIVIALIGLELVLSLLGGG